MPDSYFVLGVEDPDVGYRARLVYPRDHPLRSWMTGARFDRPPPEPIPLKLRGTDEEDWSLGDLWLTPITVMSRRLHEVLVRAGVDNLDAYAVELTDPEDGTVSTDFVAFNLVGALAVGAKEERGRADIDSLTLDPGRARGARMFRVAGSLNAIVVHASVKDAILAAGITTLTFHAPEDWVG